MNEVGQIMHFDKAGAIFFKFKRPYFFGITRYGGFQGKFMHNTFPFLTKIMLLQCGLFKNNNNKKKTIGN